MIQQKPKKSKNSNLDEIRMVEKNFKDTSSKQSIISIFLLILTTVLWGTSFIITKNIIEGVMGQEIILIS
jgi:hypothetical protein